MAGFTGKPLGRNAEGENDVLSLSPLERKVGPKHSTECHIGDQELRHSRGSKLWGQKSGAGGMSRVGSKANGALWSLGSGEGEGWLEAENQQQPTRAMSQPMLGTGGG